jgi:release factor glutamine methyltransferase
MLLEHGWTQGKRYGRCSAAGYHDVTTCRDYGDNERLTLGRFSGMEKAYESV